MKKIIFYVVSAILLFSGISLLLVQTPAMVVRNAPQECSNFSVKHGNQVFFGSNDDQYPNSIFDAEAMINIYPPTYQGAGYAEFGYWFADSRTWSRKGAVNENGFVVGTMSVPTLPLNPHPEKPISGFDKLFDTLMREGTTVEEAIQLVKQTDFSSLGDTMSFQIQFADASGDSVVISPGVDGELVFTRKPENQAYLVSTNFNVGLQSDGKWGNEYERHDTAVTLLQKTVAQNDLSETSVRNVLDAIHIETFSSFASSSRVFDLRTGDIYLYYFSQFDDGVRFNIAEAIEKGEQQILLRDLFSQETVTRGETRYQTVRIREMVTVGFMIAAALAFIGLLVIWLALRLRDRESSQRKPATRRWLSIGMGVSWAILCWSLLLFIVNSYPPNLIKPQFPMQAMLIFGPLGAIGAWLSFTTEI
ncbi:MAG TPA: hypothetical protein VLA72_09200 [Anaerolineales bacterium]|nr:hypothetical protein [Anaerolineales bacterium]